MGGRDLSGGQRLGGGRQGAAEQRSGGPDTAAGGTGTHVQSVAQPAGGRGGLDVLVGARGAAAIHGGELAEPVAFQAVHQPP
jgi:hypothetical protein